MGKCIEHTAVVERVEQEWVDVVMTAQQACASCKAQGVCGQGDGEERRLAIHTPDAPFYEVGEQVVVCVEQAMGMKAVAISYMYPFMLVLAVLLGLLELGTGELIAGSVSLGVLVLYYIVVYLFRHRIEKEIVFTIRKS